MYNWIADGKEPEKLILTSGSLAKRDDYQQVRKELGIE
jgi:L-arabinose transport system substrate-binding protein